MIGNNFYATTRPGPQVNLMADEPTCSCCSASFPIDAHINVFGRTLLCDDCLEYNMPEPGERVTVINGDTLYYGQTFKVDALIGGEVLLEVFDTYQLFKLRDIVRKPQWKEPARRKT